MIAALDVYKPVQEKGVNQPYVGAGLAGFLPLGCISAAFYIEYDISPSSLQSSHIGGSIGDLTDLL